MKIMIIWQMVTVCITVNESIHNSLQQSFSYSDANLPYFLAISAVKTFITETMNACPSL